ncbi:WS/DGAT/MGAT family O-acyltransferase [Aestuariibacter salexigens]|uniref:WS/DGAT/MGAT family O-acyltransferase n=1 Tax=Aestuariibacter salexigens TaxID=226010 RepID=UPI0004034EB7|nr:wax ester/triacylglycerol synthase family O-acyltransferase [Aestuariibacter salexigens]
MATKLNALDLAFLSLEKQTTPVNVASLVVLEVPDGYTGNYCRDLLDKLERQPAGPPFNLKLSSDSVASLPSWVEDENFDIHYHVRHSALPKPGRMKDLLELVSRLHSRLLDKGRPLWEFHLIEGLENNQIAIYMKMHHASIDGMGGVELMENCLSLSADDEVVAPWTGKRERNKLPAVQSPSLKDSAGKLVKQVSKSSQLVQDLSKMFVEQGLKAVGFKNASAPAPFTAPKSLFNVPITGARRFAINTLSLAEVKEVGKQAGATVNDMVLAACSGALRRYMMEKQNIPKKSLIATVPVSVRQLNRAGNQITYVMANLATDEGDALKRLAKIGESTQSAKQEVQEVSIEAATSFAVVAQGLVAAANQLNITSMMPPSANVTISNVPGPRQPLYFGGAKMLATYPLSVLIDGQSLNITVVSYCDTIGFGFLACRDTIPDVDKLAGYVGDAFEDIKNRLALNELLGKPL